MPDRKPNKKIARVYPYAEVMHCPDCDANLKSTGVVYPTNPPKYPLVCFDCGYTTVENQPAVRITYKLKDGTPWIE